jgi:hypothetical protein
MNKRVSEFNHEECMKLFASLPLKRMRQVIECDNRDDPLIYRDIVTIISKYCDTQTWGRLKQSCKLFNTVIIAPPMEFKPLIRRLLYRIEEAYMNGTLGNQKQRFYLYSMLFHLETCMGSFYFKNFMVDYYQGGNVYYCRKIMGNLFTDPVEQIIKNVKEAL